MSDIRFSKTELFFKKVVQKYDHHRYWKYRSVVVDPAKGSKLGDLLRLYYIKRADAFHNASMGTHRNMGAFFAEAPNLPHGLNGIIVSHNAVIGKGCTIFHQVTIGEGKDGAPTIGDNVMIGAGAKIIGGISVGHHAKVGAGCVVMQDIPAYATVFPGEVTIIVKEVE